MASLQTWKKTCFLFDDFTDFKFMSSKIQTLQRIKGDLILPGINALIVIIYKVSESRLLFVESDPGCLARLKIRLLCSQDYLPGNISRVIRRSSFLP